MKRTGLLVGSLAIFLFSLPLLTAQDAKKDADKAEKKTDETKDDEKKEPEKKVVEKKKAEPKKEKLVYSNIVFGKVVSINPASNHELTVEIKEVDPKKVADVTAWSFQRQQQLTQQLYNANMQKDVNARFRDLQNYQKANFDYQIELAKKQLNIYTPKNWDVRAAETAKVRSFMPPVEYDDVGNLKKWTKKELEERRDKTGFEGYPVDFDAIKSGQQVKLYMAKVAPKTTKKKNPDDEPVVMERPEFVMIVIMQDGK